jgi:chemotaxis protein MotA
VMKNLANIDEVGRGIAVAFVATVYGVGSANLFFLPAANKLKARVHAMVQNRELMLEGVISIIEGLNPKLIRTKLEAYDSDEGKTGKGKASKAGEAAGQTAAEGV